MADDMAVPSRPAVPNTSETVVRRSARQTADLSICVPVFKHDPSRLVKALAEQPAARTCALTLCDDGSGDAQLTQILTDLIQSWPGPATLITLHANRGRAFARNRLIAEARTDWLLLLDGDMVPDSDRFLKTYLARLADQNAPALIVGGFSLDKVDANPDQALHAAQSRRSECLAASVRQSDPGRYVFTSNILLHRTIFDTIKFDDGFQGWGWEDTDWGLRVAERFPVLHIDNTATHLGLDTADQLIAKYGGSGANFARLAMRHPQAAARMSLYRAAYTLRHMPFRGTLRRAAKAAARDRAGILPMPARLFALKLYRAACYAEAL